MKFNNLGLALDTNLKFFTSVVKGLKLKVKKFWELIPTFVEVTGEKLVEEAFCFLPPSPILNRVKASYDFFGGSLLRQVIILPSLLAKGDVMLEIQFFTLPCNTT